jgi:putative glutamine amidotransferase
MKKFKLSTLLILLLSGFLFIGCRQSPEQKAKPLKVAISKFSSHQTYRGWLHRFDGTVEFVNLYPLSVDSAMKVLKTCNGLLCTGGGDLYPALFGKLDEAGKCGTPDRHRDSLELAAIDEALNMKMPLFGICRGLQVINVALGGTLYTDLPTDIGTKVTHRTKDGQHAMHEVYVNKNAELYAISGADSGLIYSHHHQGIDRLAEGLKVGARSADSLAEEIEWVDTTGKSFLMALQWHPEHLDTLMPLSKSVAEKFLKEMKSYQKTTSERLPQ